MKVKWIVIVTAAISTIGMAGYIIHWEKKVMQRMSQENDKLISYYTLLGQWVNLKQDGKKLSTYFHRTGIKSIAIYGIGQMGQLLYDEVVDEGIEIKYLIDQSAGDTAYGFDGKNLVNLKGIERQDDVDAIIVTSCYFFEEIERELSRLDLGCHLLSLENLLYAI